MAAVGVSSFRMWSDRSYLERRPEFHKEQSATWHLLTLLTSIPALGVILWAAEREAAPRALLVGAGVTLLWGVLSSAASLIKKAWQKHRAYRP